MNVLSRWVIGFLLLPAAAASAGAMDTGPLDGTAWVLTGLEGRAVAGSPAATLQFDGDRVTGSDGCNRFSGHYSAGGSAFQVPPQLVSTQMACEPRVEAQARTYLAALTGATRHRVEGARLTLLSADGRALATLVAQSLVLAGTSWRATAINNGRQAVESIVNGTSVTLSFGADGDASGSAGCNHYAGQYETAGSRITIAKISVTAMACAEPPGVMEQEQAFLKALAAADSVRFDGDRLELRTASGALAASFARAVGG